MSTIPSRRRIAGTDSYPPQFHTTGRLEPRLQSDGEGADDRVRLMRRRDEVQVVAAACLKVEEGLREIGDGEVVALALLADLPVLAEDAGEVAAGEEDGARPAPSDERALLAEVRPGAVDTRLHPDAAAANLTVRSICTALVWAEAARRGQRKERLGSPAKNTWAQSRIHANTLTWRLSTTREEDRKRKMVSLVDHDVDP